MSEFDFTSVISRVGSGAIAVDALGMGGNAPSKPKEGFDVIPMWVADMNFPTAPTITEEIVKRTEHPFYGYFLTDPAYTESILHWQEVRNGMTGIDGKAVGYENGVLGGVATALRLFCKKNRKVLVHGPTYIGFTNVLKTCGYETVTSMLVRDADGVWRMDYDDMERKIREEEIGAAIFCSPHNPSGRVWEMEELRRAFALFQKYDVKVVSDEIWSDLILAGNKHIPSICVSEDAAKRTVALYAPSKTFNLAGLIGSYHIIPGEELRAAYEKEAAVTFYNHMNVFSERALIGAYSETGMRWVDELRGVLTENVRYALAFIREHFKGVEVAEPQGTYLLFLDCAGWCREHAAAEGRNDIGDSALTECFEQLLHKGWDVGVGWQDGRPFGISSTIRMNLALPLSRVQEAMDRLCRYVFT